MNLNNYGEVLEDASLKNYNTYGIDTYTKYLVKVNSINNLVNLINYLSDNSINYFILGGGSNIILPDNKFEGVVISLKELNHYELNDNVLVCEAGASLGKVSQVLIDNNLSGFEYISLIPGTIGGALRGNAGVKEHTIYDTLVSVDVLRDGEVITLEKKDIDISYRHTSFKENNDIILRAKFVLGTKDKEEMKDIVGDLREKRLASQPLEYRSAGSVFKNPEGNAAGKLIEECNLKGYKIGGAEVSMKHANFIINKDNATSKDIKELISYIQKEVYNKFNIELELEQIIVSW